MINIPTIKVPLIGLERQTKSIAIEIKTEVDKVIDDGFFVLGKNLKQFEKEFAKYCGTKFAIGVANGTDALLIALKSAGIGPGDDVLVPTNSFIATAEAVTHAGARPVFVDMDPQTYNIDIQTAKVTSRTKAIIPVHLYGQSADMDTIRHFAKIHDLKIIEDASQAHGATFDGKKVGSFGNAGCFSLFPTKPLGAMGDGGIITTDDEEIARRAKQLRNHGRSELNCHVIPGYTSRLDEIQAAILHVKLKYLDQWNARRKVIAEQYNQALSSIRCIKTPCHIKEANPVFYLYVIRARNRDQLQSKLSAQGIQSLIHYPIPIHLQSAYKVHRGPYLKEAEKASLEILSLPMFAELTDEEVQTISQIIKQWANTQ